MLDLLIKNARICDGTGTPSVMGNLGVKDGVIQYLGKANGQTAERVLDADGLVLAPGFVDPHTHYDAQIAWDPLLTCSPWHGVTTVVMGNCGVGVAPVKPETREILMQDLVNVEAIPYDVMKAGIDWQWESYGQYLDAVGRTGLGINVAGLVAFTPLRHYVMGEASFERAATDDEIAAMRRLLREAMEAGAFGFSTTTSRNHVGYQGRPLACRNASREELTGVVRGLADVGRGAIEIILNSGGMYAVSDEDVELLRTITQASGRPATWLAMFAHPGQPDYHDQTFAKLGDLVKQAIPQVTPRPIMSQGDLKNPTMFGSFVSWQKAFNRPAAEQIALYRIPRSAKPSGRSWRAGSAATCGARCVCWKWAGPSWRAMSAARSRRLPRARASGRWMPTSTWVWPTISRRAFNPPRSTSIPRASLGSSPMIAA